ncbi:hypothetical protein QJS10_CPB19g01547 [Acorus calamus]|uniref:Uncharacterized protein n=1 Tax=Acorus calamus TaxID=4465 RepID=A0AAV9CIQ3_ACOCL|nr:hypothetical protein QJS10_CPB19g01547 [Acorus calamus]
MEMVEDVLGKGRKKVNGVTEKAEDLAGNFCDGVDGVVVCGNGLDTVEVGCPPYLEGLVPGDGVDEVPRDGEVGDGIDVFDLKAAIGFWGGRGGGGGWGRWGGR